MQSTSLAKDLRQVLSVLPEETLYQLCQSMDINVQFRTRQEHEAELAEVLIECELVGVSLLRIKETLQEDPDLSWAHALFTSELTEQLVTRINNAQDNIGANSTLTY